MSQDLGTSGDVADLRVWRWGSRDPQRVEMWGTSLTSASIWGHQGTSLTSMPGNRNPAIPMPKDLGSGDAVDLYGRRPEGVGTSVTSTPRDLGTSRGTLQPPPPPPTLTIWCWSPPMAQRFGDTEEPRRPPLCWILGTSQVPILGTSGTSRNPPPLPSQRLWNPPPCLEALGGSPLTPPPSWSGGVPPPP